MAGYLFTFSDEESLFETMRRRVYTTLMNVAWNRTSVSTLGDYVTMCPGDSVYFFSRRMVYGIGKIVQAVPRCTVLENFEGSTGATLQSENELPSDALVDVRAEGKIGRWVIAFEPDPYMFTTGIDMDDLLTSNPRAFRSLRVFWKRSFIKLDDDEDMAFRAAILRRNVDVLYDASLQKPFNGRVQAIDKAGGSAYLNKASAGRSLAPKVRELVARSRIADGHAGTEMTLEVALLHQLGEYFGINPTATIFGHWDYLSHQVHASPAKAVDYMDKIDIFGYKWIYRHKPIVEKYVVMELKRDTVFGSDLQQLMKYVDWVRNEYANGDYSLVKAYLVGYEFNMDSINFALPTIERYSLSGYRPPKPYHWSDVRLVSYYVEETGYVRFRFVR